MAPETRYGRKNTGQRSKRFNEAGARWPRKPNTLRSLRTDWIIFLTCERWVLRFQISMISPCNARNEST